MFVTLHYITPIDLGIIEIQVILFLQENFQYRNSRTTKIVTYV